MVEHQSEFCNLVDLILGLQERRVQDIDPGLANMSPEAFLRDFCTVRIDIGRQSGKTHYIKTRCSDLDLIITPTDHIRVHLDASVDCQVISVNSPLPIGKYFDTIWIDEWIFIKDKERFFYWMAKLNPIRIVIFGGE